MRKILCGDLYEVANVVNHNTETAVRMIQRTNKELGRLRRKGRSYTMVGFMFGIAVELCFIAQSQRLTELEERLNDMSMEVKELKDKEGE